MPQFALDKVTIRGLRHLSLDGLGRITVLVGENNSEAVNLSGSTTIE